MREWSHGCTSQCVGGANTGATQERLQGGVMKAEIVWRNPLPPANDRSSIERVTSNNCGVVYAVSTPFAEQKFELIQGGTA